MDEDDNDNHYEVNMEKIMQRFSNYNTLSMSSSNQDDDDDEEENKKNTGLEEVHDNDKNHGGDGAEELFKDIEQNQKNDRYSHEV
jgi:hypothetical protein